MPFQRSFGAGEISPSLYSGADLPRYKEGVATCRNFVVKRQGGLENRAGLQFLAEVKDSSKRTWLRKFVFSQTDTYVIEFGNLYIRFFAQGGQVEVESVPAYSAVTSYDIGDIVSSVGVNYYSLQEPNLNHTPASSPTFWYPLSGAILEIPTPYLEAHLPDLVIAQSGDVLTITHPLYPPYELSRFTDHWTMLEAEFGPWETPVAGLNVVAGTAGPLTFSYIVTAISDDGQEETDPNTPDTVTCSEPTILAPNVLSWTAKTGALEYKVYLDKYENGTHYYIGTAASNSFNDAGFFPDESLSPPIERVVFDSAGDYPAAVTHYQQRAVYAGSVNEPEKVRTSQTGYLKNFSISSPIQDDDAVSFTIPQARFIRHLLEVADGLFVLSSEQETLLQGDEDGVLRPTAIGARKQSGWGSSTVPPALVGNNVLYVQARGSTLRDIKFDGTGLEGRDLTVFAAHLTTGYQLEQIDYAQHPNSVVWAVRSDGNLLGLTYLRELDRWGWHVHDSENGLFESVCVIPESIPTPAYGEASPKKEDYLYCIVKRTIGGQVQRYVERMVSRTHENFRLDAIHLDSHLTYSGINTTVKTVTLSTATTWTAGSTITVTASASTFSAGDVGNGVSVWDPDTGEMARITIVTYTSATVVSGTVSFVDDTVTTTPVSLRAVATLNWSLAVDAVSGLNHLEGEAVSILANGIPLTATVASGAIALPAAYDVIHIGLPITSELETLDLEADDDAFRDKKKLIKHVSLLVEHCRGVLGGADEDHLSTWHHESTSVLGLKLFTDPGLPRNELIEGAMLAQWEKDGRIFIRQAEPLPLHILGIIPGGDLGG